jgi:hypothetical protein
MRRTKASVRGQSDYATSPPPTPLDLFAERNGAATGFELDATEKARLETFLQLARRGIYGNCSKAENRAFMLAAAMLDNANGLDTRAIHGAIFFLLQAHHSPKATTSLLYGQEGAAGV